MHGAKCAVSNLVFVRVPCSDVNHSLVLVAYRLVHTDEPYTELCTMILYFSIVYYLQHCYMCDMMKFNEYHLFQMPLADSKAEIQSG